MRITGSKIVRAIFSSFCGKSIESSNSQSSVALSGAVALNGDCSERRCGAVICKALSGAMEQAIT